MRQTEPDIRLTQEDGRVRFLATARDNPPLALGISPPWGDGEGYTPMELLLVSLASCAAFSLLTLMRGKMKKEVASIDAQASGTYRESRPKAFSRITVHYTVRARDTSPEEVETALAVTEEKLCPVWAMLKDSVELGASFEVIPVE